MDAPSPRIGIVTGMRFERAVLMRWRGALGERMPLVGCAGASAERAAEEAEALVARGAGALISFGVAGALDATLRSGALFLPYGVVAEDGGEWTCDDRWRGALEELVSPLVDCRTGRLAGTSAVADTPARKRGLGESLDAQAVDMESAAVALVAGAHELPFIAIRAIADTANQTVPAAALAAARPDGSVSAMRALALCLRAPGEIPALIRLGRQTAAAKRTLARVAHAGLPFFALA